MDRDELKRFLEAEDGDEQGPAKGCFYGLMIGGTIWIVCIGLLIWAMTR
jgi:hypothetical protein